MARTILGHFNKIKKNAKEMGKILACFLAQRVHFKHHTFTLVGHSLGTQVIKSCLETLHEIYGQANPAFVNSANDIHCDLIQNVVLMAGASEYHGTQDNWIGMFKNVVNGSVKNLHSDYDFVVRRLYQPFNWEWGRYSTAIGTNPLKLKSETNDKSAETLIENINVTWKSSKYWTRHSTYTDPVGQRDMSIACDLKWTNFTSNT